MRVKYIILDDEPQKPEVWYQREDDRIFIVHPMLVEKEIGFEAVGLTLEISAEGEMVPSGYALYKLPPISKKL